MEKEPGMSRIEKEVLEAEEKTKLLHYYRQMLGIRRVEEASAKAYSQQKIGGFLHLYIGQEAVGVGAVAALKPEDYVMTSYRDHGLAYAKGMSARAIMAELFAKETGCSKGLGGSMHFFDAPNNFVGGWGIVGGHLPLAAGIAFASKYRNDGRVCLCFFGDGAISQGAAHEAFSLAALWKLPVVFICENNLYSMGTPLERSLSVDDTSIKALAYGMARDRFDGNDVLKVRDRIGDAVRRARFESLPTLIEVRCYRYRGHSMSDPGLYRTKDEVEEAKKQDCLFIARQHLEKLGTEAKVFDDIEEAVRLEVEDAVKFADESGYLPADRLEEFNYVD
jgi:pyruvate dehydrogenase E1 component alpha subunit